MKKIVSILFSIFVFQLPAYAQIPYARGDMFPAELSEKLNERISLDLREISVIDVLKFLATKADVNIVASQNISARVTLFLKDVTIENALDIILLSTGLAIREKEGILYVMTDEEYTSLYGEAYRDQRQIKILQLKYADAGKLGEILGGMKSAIGKIILDKQTGTLVLIDTAEKVQLMVDAAKRIDIPTVQRILPTQTAVFELSYNKAADVQAQITTFLTPDIGSAKVDEKTNRIFVTDFEEPIERIRQVIEAFDRKTRQVFIETKMIQVRLSNDYQMGIEWQQIINEGVEKDKFKIDNSGTFPISSSTTQFGKVIFGDLGKDDIEATIKLLHEFGETRTLAAPQLTVEHNEEANILVGTREAYATSTVSQASSTTTTSESITFIDVGVKLKVVPMINKNRFVSLKIAPEISAVGRTITTQNDNEIPIVDTTNASTTVLVKDGSTVIIGGLMKDEVVKTVRKYPMLGDIPWLGALFRSTDDSVIKTELVIFLTPHIVEGDEALPFSPSTSSKKFEGLRSF